MKRSLTAKQIGKLRRKAHLMRDYKIRESASLFGDFDGSNRMCLIMNGSDIKGISPVDALLKYLKNYQLKYKRKHENHTDEPYETTIKWGKFMVKDIETGYKTFFK